MISSSYSFAFSTKKGPKKSKNEDSVLCNSNLSLFAVADGLGSPHRHGDVASQLALEVLEEYFSSELENSQIDPHNLLQESFLAAHTIVMEAARSNTEYLTMGTTLCCLFFHQEKAFFAYAGDSSIFRLRDQSIERLCNEHAVSKDGKKLLTQAVGYHDEIKVDINTLEIAPGDLLLLCTDGISDFLSEEDIKAIYVRHRFSPLDAFAKDLMTTSDFKNSLDDKTAIAIKVQ